MVKLCPSLMCADFGNFRQEIADLDAAGVYQYHLDIMDGEFVPNFALSWADVAAIRKMTNTKLDVHLMVKKPAVHLPYAFKYGIDIIYVHYESGDAAKHLYEIRQNGCKAGLAINPATTVDEIRTLLPLLDSILIMRVHPGFAGQVAIPDVEDKIAELASMDGRKFTIRLDGAVSMDIIRKWAARGVEEFVCGTASGMFGDKRGNRSYADVLGEIRNQEIYNVKI